MGHDLLERRIGVGVELHLDDGAHAVHRHADRRADDARLRKRGIPHPVRSEFGPQSFGDPKNPAEAADILTEDEHSVVCGQGITQRLVEGLRHRHR